MRYINNVCDGCGKAFEENDDIVVCPECATPQHRECYEKNNRCVNADKHAEGFEWKSSVDNKAADSLPKQNIVCPVCGFGNDAHASECSRCGEKFVPFSAPQIEEKQPLFENMPDSDEPILEEHEKKQIEQVLNMRARTAAPGMSAEQEQEIVAGHPIKQVMTFITSKALAYVNKFRSLEKGKKLTWNWAAFFFSPYWFFYRKMYKPGIVFLTARICLSLLLYGPANKAAEIFASVGSADALSAMTDEAYAELLSRMFSAILPVYIGLGVMLVLAIVSALIGDRLYKKYVRSSIDEAKAEGNRDRFLLKFLKRSSVSPLAAALSYTAASIIPGIVMSFFI